MTPTAIKLHRRSGILELSWEDGGIYTLNAEFLRVHSPSAEVRGHGIGQEILQTGKKDVRIDSIDAVGNYAIRLHFDDDHNTGIYSWEYLWELCQNQAQLWEEYIDKLRQAGGRRENLPDGVQAVNIVGLFDPQKKADS